MLETLDLSKKLRKQEYRSRLPVLQRRLLQLQHACWEVQLASIIVFEGWESTFRAELMTKKITERIEPRGFSLHAILAPRTFEVEMPWMWRFWVKLPNWGHMAMFDRSWYTRLIMERVEKNVSEREWRNAFEDIVNFERMLADDRYLITKLFLHVDHKSLSQRLKKLKGDPLTSWQVSEEDRRHARDYDAYLEAIEEMLARTESEWAPWTLIEAADKRWAAIEVMERIIARLEWGLRAKGHDLPESPEADDDEPEEADDGNGNNGNENEDPPERSHEPMLETVDLSKAIEDRNEYRKQLLENQVRLRWLAHELYRQKRSLIIVFQGWDAAGKGGAIRRVTEKIDPRGYEVYSIAAPDGADKTHHYLWRFWRRLKASSEKQVLIFDRSWYERVMVERVEGFATEDEWKRAYREINDFERQMTDAGILMAKFWFHISEEEQLRRFEARRDTPHKKWKLTDEDWRNRKKWGRYEDAVEEMLTKTSTLKSPWTIVEANDKRYARVKVLTHLVGLLSPVLDPGGKKLAALK